MVFLKLIEKYNKVLELGKSGRLREEINKYFYMEIVPIEKKIENIEIVSEFPGIEKGVEILEVSSKLDLHDWYEFSKKSYIYRAKGYLKNGYHGVLLIRGKQILGHMWYTDNVNPCLHPEIELLPIIKNKDSAYIFDLFIDEQLRGKNFSNDFMNFSLNLIKQKGYKKVYGYYTVGNFSSQWLHRMMGFTEFPMVVWKRFPFKRRIAKNIVK